MGRNNYRLAAGIFTVVIIAAFLLAGCSGKTTTNPPPTGSTSTTGTIPSGGAVINSDSIITGEIKALRAQTTGYPWQIDVLVESSANVDNLPNPTIDKIGQVITFKTDQDLSAFKAGQAITAKVEYVGDVPLPGISLYIYNIQAADAAVKVGLGQQFSLGIGQAAAVTGEDFAIKFVALTADSRCPRGVTCIWAGEVSCQVAVTANASSYQVVLTQGGGADQAIQTVVGHDISFHVEPYPAAGQPITQDQYRLVMTVTKTESSTVEISPAPINDVKIAVTLVQPKEVLVYIQGGLRDTCTTFNNMTVDRTGSTINIKVTVQTETGKVCGQIYTFFERCVDLGADFVSGQTYTVNVNDKINTFTMP
jgi:hypothetical protein